MLVVPCRRGGVPCLTPTMLREILEDEERLLSLSVFDAVEHIKPLLATKQSFAQFCCLDEFRVLLSVRSSFTGTHTSAPSSEQGVAGDHDTGRIVVSVKKLSEIASAVRPHWIAAISDAGCVDEPPNKKRRTAVERSCRWYDSLVSDASPTNTDRILIPSTVFRCRAPAPAADVLPAGLYLDAVNQNESLGSKIAYARDAADRFAQSFPEPPQRQIISHAESIPAILGLVASGVSHIETAIPWQLASKGKALCLPLTALQADTRGPSEIVLDLNDPTYRWTKSPLSPTCRCYTCRRHTRCYLHHLLSVQEMNSEILLVIHNLTQIVDMLRLVRQTQGTTSTRAIAPFDERNRIIGKLLALFHV